jgi:hypothetical protein
MGIFVSHQLELRKWPGEEEQCFGVCAPQKSATRGYQLTSYFFFSRFSALTNTRGVTRLFGHPGQLIAIDSLGYDLVRNDRVTAAPMQHHTREFHFPRGNHA